MTPKEILPSEHVLDAIFEAVPDILFLMSQDGIILDHRAKKNTDLYTSPENFIRKTMQEVLPINVGKQFAEKFENLKLLKVLQTFEYTLDLNGNRKYFEARLNSLPDNNLFIAYGPL